MPFTNSLAISFSPRPPTIPDSRPMARNTMLISSIYQPLVTRPHTMTPMPTPNTISTSFWRSVKGMSESTLSTANSSRFARSSW